MHQKSSGSVFFSAIRLLFFQKNENVIVIVIINFTAINVVKLLMHIFKGLELYLIVAISITAR